MVRPRNADSAATFESIRAAAMELLQTGGIDAVSVRRVAEKAGVGMGTLRYYFPRREDLVEACLDYYHQNLMALEEQMVQHIHDSDDPRKAAADAVRAAYRMVAAQPQIHRLRVLTSLRQGELPEARRRAVRGPFLKNSAQVLSTITGVPRARLRMVVDAVMRLVAWYAASTEDELLDITGTDSADEARQAVEDHLAYTAVQLVFAPPQLVT